MIQKAGLFLLGGLVAATLSAPAVVFAQAAPASSPQKATTTTGTVTDISGAVIPKADITVTAADGRTSTIASDSEGRFDAGLLASTGLPALFDPAVTRSLHAVSGERFAIAV